MNQGFPDCLAGKNPPAVQDTLVWFLSWEDRLEKGEAAHSSNSWASLVARLVKNPPAMRKTWVRSLAWKIPWIREQLPTPVFWPREFHGLYGPWGCKESDRTQQLFIFQDELTIGIHVPPAYWTYLPSPPLPIPLGWYRAAVWVPWDICKLLLPVCFTSGSVSFHVTVSMHLPPPLLSPCP